MCGDGGGSIHARLGILTSGISVENLRFCPNCIEEDEEPYWHRVHQVPGVEACPLYNVFLADSKVSVRNRVNSRALVTTRQAVAEIPSASRATRPLDLGNREHQVILQLARDAAWILSSRMEVPGQEVLQRRYLRLLLEQGMASYTGKVRHVSLKTQFLAYYPPGLLKRLRCGLELKSHWLYRLLNNWKSTRHPLYHLLLMQFLGIPAAEFFQLPIKVEPFGKGPWPCLNAAGGHFREARVKECLISHTQDTSKRLVGTFRCECGFSYRRTGPDTTDERRYQWDRVMSFGEAWYEKLSNMLALGNQSLPEIAGALGVPINTIKGECCRLNTSNELEVPRMRRFERRNKVGPALSDLPLSDIHRKKWIEVVAENPNVGRSVLGRMQVASYHWLLEHDKKWLDDNSPPPLKSSGPVQRIDWSERDEKFAAAVRETAEKILTVVGRPLWASRTRIPKELRILTVLRKNSAKLPLTNKALDDVSESQAAFAAQRIRWAADCYRQEQVSAAAWQLQTRAAVSNKMARDPEVKAACEECVQALRAMNVAGWEVLAKGKGR
ncbi:MAG TPA: TnsD family Tn7-like transposition protein [Pyrinomonadaceae bacterium]|nr:TnsD family Tn7-like transposition protein [Pyrinomonadaceae bacterium]